MVPFQNQHPHLREVLNRDDGSSGLKKPVEVPSRRQRPRRRRRRRWRDRGLRRRIVRFGPVLCHLDRRRRGRRGRLGFRLRRPRRRRLPLPPLLLLLQELLLLELPPNGRRVVEAIDAEGAGGRRRWRRRAPGTRHRRSISRNSTSSKPIRGFGNP